MESAICFVEFSLISSNRSELETSAMGTSMRLNSSLRPEVALLLSTNRSEDSSTNLRTSASFSVLLISSQSERLVSQQNPIAYPLYIAAGISLSTGFPLTRSILLMGLDQKNPLFGYLCHIQGLVEAETTQTRSAARTSIYSISLRSPFLANEVSMFRYFQGGALTNNGMI